MVDAAITGLGRHDYYFRVSASNRWERSSDIEVSPLPMSRSSCGRHGCCKFVGATTATLNGSVDSDGLETNARFQYGTDSDRPLCTGHRPFRFAPYGRRAGHV